MIRSFRNVGTEDIFHGRSTKAARKTCPQQLWKVAARKLDQLDSVIALDELRIPPGNRLEALATGQENIASGSISSTVFVSCGRQLDLITLKL